MSETATIPPLTDTRFGAIAVWGELIGEAELEAALQQQALLRSTGAPVHRIGELLVARGSLSDEQVQRVLRVQLQRMPSDGHTVFGEISSVSRLVSREDVQRALDIQSRQIIRGQDVCRIGEILVDMGVIDDKEAEAILAYQARGDARPLTEMTHEHAQQRAGRTAAGPDRRVYLPVGVAGFVSDNIIWIVLGISSLIAMILATFRDAVFG